MVALWVFCLGVPVAPWEGYRNIPGAIEGQPRVTYGELVTILLTGLTAALALFAVVAGLLAIWGYSNIKQEAAAAASAAVELSVKTAVDRHLNDQALGDTIKKELRPIVRSVVHEEVSPDFIGALYAGAFPQAQGGEGQAEPPRIAEELPGENDEAR